MSRIKLLLDVVSDMRSLADSIQALADVIVEIETIEKVETITPAMESETGKMEKIKKKEIMLEEVRAVLAEKSQSGFTAEVREIIKKYGGSKLSEIAPEHYSDILKAAEVLGNE